MQYSIESNPFFASDFFEVKSPEARTVDLPQRCYPHAWEHGCFSFVASPNDTSTEIGRYAADVSAQMALDGGFGGRGEKYGYELFDDGEYIDDWLFQNQNATPVSVLFHHHGSPTDPVPKIAYTIQFNDTIICNTIGVLDCSDPKSDLMASYQRLIDQSILRLETGNPSATLSPSFSDFPHPAGVLEWDVMRDYGSDWLYVTIVFNFVIQLTYIVMEKEKGLRASMTQMGLRRSAYWVSWFISCEIINLCVVILLCAFGNSIQMEFFLENGFAVYFTMFFMSTTAFTLLAFFFSTLISSTEGARSFGIMWYVITFIACPVVVFLYFYSGKEKDRSIIEGLSLIAATPYFKGVGDMVWASSGGQGQGMLWKRKGETTSTKADIETAVAGWDGDEDSWYSVDDAYWSLFYCCLLYAGATWYFDHIVPNTHGLAEHPLFFLDPVYWGFEDSKKKRETTAPLVSNVNLDEVEKDGDDDVAAEEAAVNNGTAYDGKAAVVIKGLQKTFASRVYEWVPSNSWAGGLIYGALPAVLFALVSSSPMVFIICWVVFTVLLKFLPSGISFRLRILPTRKMSTFSAVKGVSYAIEENSLFVLLGHNGAGKSTSFNMLTGLMPLTGGDATIMGYSVKYEMAQISKIMGVCPQHDVLWDNLTGREHLELFARLKAIPSELIQEEVEARLVDVCLEDSADVLSSQYSGGMQRRLSLAIALLGDPKIVFLDEPTTGMDPVTRRKVWDTINRVKRGRVIILTTHSMEEAEILGDRVAIMSGGRLSCIGSSLHLKNKFGGGFRLSVVVNDPVNAEEVQKLITDESHGVGATFVSKTQDVLLFKLGTHDATLLSPFFEKIEDAKQKYGISDLSIGNATLNDVFINLSVAEAKSDDTVHPTEDKEHDEEQTCSAGCYKCCLTPSRFCGDCGDCSCCCKCTESTAPKDKEEKKSNLSATPKGQVYALVQKSLAFQMRQKKLMCCIIMFPTIFIILIALLGALVFDPMTQNALDKYDWGCLKEQLRETEYLRPAISVGNISPKNQQFKNDDWPPLFYLETPSFEFFVSSDEGNDLSVEVDSILDDDVVGSLTEGNSSVFTWHRKWLSKFPNLYVCTKRYNNQYEDELTYKSGGAVNYDDPASVSYAEEWSYYGNASRVLSYSNCKSSNTVKRRQLTTPPDSSAVNKLNFLNANLSQCEEVRTPLRQFDDVNATDVLLAQASTSKGKGVLDYLSFGMVFEQVTVDYINSIISAAYSSTSQYYTCSLGGGNSSRACRNLPSSYECQWNFLSEETCDWAPSGGVAEGSPALAIPNMAAYLCANVTVDVNSPLRAALASALAGGGGGNFDDDAEGDDRVDGFCTWYANLDAVRGMRTDRVGDSRSDLNKKLLKDWKGTYDPYTETHRTKFSSFHFIKADKVSANYGYILYINYTGLCGQNEGRDEECETDGINDYQPVDDYLVENSPLTRMMMTLLSRMDAAIIKSHTDVDLEVGLKTFPGILDKCSYDPFGCASINDFIASNFLPYIFLVYVFVIQGLIVFEKANGLRDIMVMSGLKMRVYWAVLWAFYFVQYMIMVVVLWVAGSLTSLRTFELHDPGVLLLFFFVWGQCMIAFSFMLTTFFTNPRTATVVLLLVTILSVQAGSTLLVQLILNPNIGGDEVPYLPYMWFPPLVMLRGLLWLIYGAAFNAKCDFGNLADYGHGAIMRCMLYMAGETIIMIPLTWYLESVLSVGGSAKPALFPCIELAAWGRTKFGNGQADMTQTIGADNAQNGASSAQGDKGHEPADVKQERVRAEAGGSNQAVRVIGFQKVFYGRNGAPDKVAVKDLSFAVNKNECFGLLGHNGAGKTTTISMLCGLFKPTAGKAIIAGFDLNSELSNIHEVMGVCPQHDILWDDLTAKEHLVFYARLRKVPPADLNEAVAKALAAVNLTAWGNVLSSKFSGGMKRRLSTACSLVGEPQVVYMDEPSTGLDPASRHRLWEVISQSKGKNSILLTTHSMEEADVLCERIGIMGAGDMQCIGTSAELKSRYGAGYRLSLHIKDKSDEAAKVATDAVVALMPSAKLLNEAMGGILDFEVPSAEVKLSVVYTAIEAERDRIGILDWGITESTLEEVFLAVTGHDSHHGVIAVNK